MAKITLGKSTWYGRADMLSLEPWVKSPPPLSSQRRLDPIPCYLRQISLDLQNIFSPANCALRDDAHCKVTRKCRKELEHSVEKYRKGTSLGYETTSSNMLFGQCLYKCDGEQYKHLSLLSLRIISPHLFLQLLQPPLIGFSQWSSLLLHAGFFPSLKRHEKGFKLDSISPFQLPCCCCLTQACQCSTLTSLLSNITLGCIIPFLTSLPSLRSTVLRAFDLLLVSVEPDGWCLLFWGLSMFELNISIISSTSLSSELSEHTLKTSGFLRTSSSPWIDSTKPWPPP